MRELDLKTAYFKIHENGLIIMTIKSGVTLDLEDISFNRNEVLKVTGSKITVMLIEAEGHILITREAREESAKEEYMKYLNALAIVSDLLAHKLLGNFFIKFNKPAKPTRFFTNKNKATEWLISML